jgi:hypothetical protein
MLTEEQQYLVFAIQSKVDDLENDTCKILDAYEDMKYRTGMLNHYLKKLKDPSHTLPWETPEALEAKRQYKSLGTLLGKTSC